jgi:hypothetical protein
MPTYGPVLKRDLTYERPLGPHDPFWDKDQRGVLAEVRERGATGVRWPRPCPICAEAMDDVSDREAHRDRHFLEGRL